MLKLDEKENKNMKGISKAIYVIAKIMKICFGIGLFFYILFFISAITILPNINTTDKTIKVYKSEYKYEFSDNTIKINDKVVADDFEGFELDKLNEFLNNTNSYKIGFISVLSLEVITVLIFLYLLFKNTEKLFKNICELDTPFNEDNLKHINNIALFLAIVTLVPLLFDLIMILIFKVNMNVNVSMTNILLILIAWSLYYVFKYGYNLENKNKVN